MNQLNEMPTLARYEITLRYQLTYNISQYNKLGCDLLILRFEKEVHLFFIYPTSD